MVFLKRLWHLVPILFLSWKSAQTILFLLLFVTAGGEQGAVYFVGLIPSHFYMVLPAQDWSGFITTLWQSLLYLLLISLIKSAKTYISKLLFVTWREALTTHLHNLYFKAFNYYKLNVLQTGNIDNTDQRITQDAKRLCHQLSLVAPTLIVSPFTIATYTYLTYRITGYLGPLVIYCYFIIGSVINRFIMSPVVNLTYQEEKQEGIFRFKHAQLRANSESVAFYSAGETEKANTDHKLSNLLDVQITLTNWEFWLNVAVNLFDYVGTILSYVIIAIPIFAGVYNGLPPSEISSLISAYSFQTTYLISCFSNLIDLSNKITDIASFTQRMGELLESLEKLSLDTDEPPFNTTEPSRSIIHLDPDNDRIISDTHLLISETEMDRHYLSEDSREERLPGGRGAALEEDEDVNSVDSLIAFQLDQVAVATPSKEDVLIRDLTLEVVEGRNILITGATGSGKTALLRVLHGLWPVLRGTIERRGVQSSDIMFLPQKAYLSDGTLMDQISYPSKAPKSFSRSLFEEDPGPTQILDKVGLEGLVQRCDGLHTPVTWNWHDVLTPGEAQCLAFARLLYQRPKFALLDEATSALPSEKEALLYSFCREAKMTLISVGHHVTLKRFHDAELIIDGQGGWTYKLDLLFLKRLGHLVPILFSSWKSAQTILFLLLLVVTGGEQGAAYFVGLIPSQFYVVLPAQDWSGFITTLWQSLLYLLLISLSKSAKTYISELLLVKWRGALTTHLHNLYFKAFNYYKLNAMQTDNIDNTDQRITQDVKRLCHQLNMVVPTFIVSPFTISTYSYLTYRITGYLGPLVIYCYFIIGGIINRFIMSTVVRLTYQEDKLEGIFRFKHAQLRANSESVAFYSAGETEKANADHKLSNLLDVQITLTNWEFWLNVAVNLFDYFGNILSHVIIAIPIFAGVYNGLPPSEISSLISAYSFQTTYLISCFSSLINLSNKITDIASFTQRVGELLESLEKLSTDTDDPPIDPTEPSRTILHLDPDNERITSDTHLLISETEMERHYLSEDSREGRLPGRGGAALEKDEDVISVDSLVAFQLDQVAVATPSKEDVLIRDLTLEVVEGRNILITGATGSGKTSLLRVLHGLWPVPRGTIERRGVRSSDIMFLPQKAYLSDGTLMDQITYPSKAPRSFSRSLFEEDPGPTQILDMVGLEGLVQHCDGLHTQVTWNWYDVLTPGEAQCLAFARLLYQRPKFALLDEATSALPSEKQALLYSLCREAKMTLISVGHHVTLKRFHDAELIIDGQGGWTLVDITHIE